MCLWRSVWMISSPQIFKLQDKKNDPRFLHLRIDFLSEAVAQFCGIGMIGKGGTLRFFF